MRRRAQARGIRPLPLHSARHTWATLALASGKSIRWVAEQLWHSDPALTLRVYAHVLREEEVGLSFADFSVSKRLYAAPLSDEGSGEARKYPERLAPPARLERATYGLGSCAGSRERAPGGPRGHSGWQSLAKRVLAGPRRSHRRSYRRPDPAVKSRPAPPSGNQTHAAGRRLRQR